MVKETLAALERVLVRRGYSPATRRAYRRHVERILEHVGRDAPDISAPEIQEYFQSLASGGVSGAVRDQAISAIKFLYHHVLGRPEAVPEIARPRRATRLPIVLSRDEVVRLLRGVGNLKHRVILLLVYAGGLRASEVARLRVADVDGERNRVFVCEGGGREGRYTIVGEAALEALREYWRSYRPREWLFEGVRPGSHIATRTVHAIFRKARERAGIGADVTVGSLRYSFAVHLFEEGVDLRHIQALLGHRHLRTTRVYARVESEGGQRIRSPLDSLELKESGGEYGADEEPPF
jgi:integrase/recombinase XerD